MTVRGIVITGLIGIAILVLVALVGIGLFGSRAAAPAPGAAPPPGPVEPLPPLTPPSQEAAVQVAEAPRAPPAPPPRSVAPAAAPAPAGDGPAPWEAVPLAFKPAGLGAGLAAPVTKGLAEARQGTRHCFADERRRLSGASPEPVPAGAVGPAVLVVRLEAPRDGRLTVAGTELASRGTSSRQLIECFRRSLEGYELDAPAAAPPARYRVQLLVQ